jgi:hypothetical protein
MASVQNPSTDVSHSVAGEGRDITSAIRVLRFMLLVLVEQKRRTDTEG